MISGPLDSYTLVIGFWPRRLLLLLLWLCPLLRFRIRLFWPFLILRFLINPGLLLSTCNHSRHGKHAPPLPSAQSSRLCRQTCNAPTLDRQPVTAMLARSCCRVRSNARRSGAVDRQSVVVSSRRNIRLSFVPGHAKPRSTFSHRVHCDLSPSSTCSVAVRSSGLLPERLNLPRLHPQRLRGQRPGTDP